MIFIVTGAVSLTLIGGLIWLTRKDAFHHGGDEAEKRTAENIINDVKTANAIRDKLLTNDEYSRRVRERFTRD